LSQISLRARDQYGDLIELPDDITWNLASNNQTNASIEHGQLTVPEGTVPEASVADVILEAYSPKADRTASNVVVKVRQKPVLKRLTATMTNDLHLRVDENAVLIHYFTVAGYDQYGGANLITLTGENLEDGLRISAFDEIGSVVRVLQQLPLVPLRNKRPP